VIDEPDENRRDGQKVYSFSPGSSITVRRRTAI
jgi:hypothetical protein